MADPCRVIQRSIGGRSRVRRRADQPRPRILDRYEVVFRLLSAERLLDQLVEFEFSRVGVVEPSLVRIYTLEPIPLYSKRAAV